MKGFILDDDKRMKYTELELIKNNAIIYDSLNMPEKLDFIFLGINGISSIEFVITVIILNYWITHFSTV